MEFTKKVQPLMTNGTPLNVGDQLPDFTVIDAVGNAVNKQTLLTKTTLISVVPNINTPVCSLSTKHFNDEIVKYPDVNFMTISTNTAAEQQTWRDQADVTRMPMYSDAAHHFGEAMGLFIASAGIDARSVWIVDQTGKILYRELVTELSHEPNYDAALTRLQKLS